jgi:hypothetical protein
MGSGEEGNGFCELVNKSFEIIKDKIGLRLKRERSDKIIVCQGNRESRVKRCSWYWDRL